MVLETAFLLALVVGLVEVAKKFGLPSRWLPVLALVIGVGLNFLFQFLGVEYGGTLLGGIVAGLSAVGLYSGTKSVVGK